MKKNNQEIYAARRSALMGRLEEGAVVIVPSATQVFRNSDVHYPFRQNSDFWYLTGFPESDAIAVLVRHGGTVSYRLFCQPENEQDAQWHGPRIGLEGACSDYGSDESHDLNDFDQVIEGIIAEASVWYCLKLPQLTVGVYQLSMQSGCLAKSRIQPKSLESYLHEMRLLKDEHELACMREAADVSVQAHLAVMKQLDSLQTEYEVLAVWNHVMQSNGCHLPAYDAIVAGGDHACTLHYTRNNARLNKSDLLLIDAGAEFDYYAADITRTMPISGKFTAEQRALYELVLAAQEAVIAMVKPGVTWRELQAQSVQILASGLIDLGILSGSVHDVIATEAYKRFYMHGIGHWLGLDVHDVGSKVINGAPRPFQANMVITVEPGLYIPTGADQVEERWQGIGIRIEDNVLVTATGAEVLTQALPRSAAEIEALMVKN